MSVNPGFGGQSFITASIERIRAVKEMIAARGAKALIEVDGGIGEKTIAAVAAAGADVFVAGSAIYGSPDYAKTIRTFRKLLEE
jgi:ribulose-phosphate 3-epimerase